VLLATQDELEAELRLAEQLAEEEGHGVPTLPRWGSWIPQNVHVDFSLSTIAFTGPPRQSHHHGHDQVARRGMPRLRVAVDVGGTFTDIFVFDESTSSVRVAKVPSTPADPMEGVMSGIAAAEVDLRDVALFSHGTTVATNALLTRRFPRVAMVTTRGFRDVIEIRRGTKDDLWDAYRDVAPPYVRRRDRLEVTERIDYAGRVVEGLDEDEARRVAAVLRRREVEAVAVCFVNAYANPDNERRMQAILRRSCPASW